jgi:hypothetical protein
METGVITPEPTEVEHHERVDLPSDEGLRSLFLSCVVETPEMGAAGHLGVIEEECPAHHLAWLERGVSCPTCGASVSERRR